MSQLAKLSKVCDACKRRKIRCDRQSPACGYCRAHGYDCNFSVVKKPGIAMKLQHLAAAVERIENSLGGLGARLDQIESAATIRTTGTSRRTSGAGVGSNGGSPRTAHEPVDPSSPAKIHPSPPTAVTRSALSAELSPTTPLGPPIAPATLARCVEAFLDWVHPLLPVDPAPFAADAPAQVLDPGPLDPHPGSTPAYAAAVLTLRLIDPTTTAHASCKAYVLATAIGAADATNLSCLLLLAYSLLGDNLDEFTSVFVVVQAACDRLALWTEHGKNTAAHEHLRRLAWAVYALDCTGVLMGREPRIVPPPADLLLPVVPAFVDPRFAQDRTRRLSNLDRDPLLDDAYDSTSFCLEMLHFLRQTVLLIHSYNRLGNIDQFNVHLQQIKSNVNDWNVHLSGECGNILYSTNYFYKDNFSVVDLLFHSCFNMYLVAVHACVLPDETFFDFNLNVCKKAADRITHLCRSTGSVFQDRPMYQFGLIYAAALYVAARVHWAWCVEKHGLDCDWHYLVTKLREMGPVWNVAQMYADSLEGEKTSGERKWRGESDMLFDIFERK